MFLGRVRGEMVATLKHRALERRRLLWVERTAPDGTGLGRSTLAVDHAQAGEGDMVLVLDEGNGASQVLDRPRGPIRTVIVGIVDEVDYRARADGTAEAGGSAALTDAGGPAEGTTRGEPGDSVDRPDRAERTE